MLIVTIIFIYCLVLFAISHLTSHQATNTTFFRANRKSPWYMVAFGMIGASISGVTFVSVPGMVMRMDMNYLQTCLGFILGYLVIAFILLPIYYKLNVTTIYSYLKQRFGMQAYKTGAVFFILSDLTGVAVKFYIVCIILQQYVLSTYNIPFYFTVPILMSLIWLYTHKGGIKTLVWTDFFQTLCMLTALILIIIQVTQALQISPMQAVKAIMNNPHSHIFVTNDWLSPQNFWKQFISGAFIVIVMTGLNQNMMQKNLTCKTLSEAQKDMCTYGLSFVPVNLLFLSLGVLLMLLANKEGIALPNSVDDLLPMFAATGKLGTATLILFIVGIVSASFSTVDSSLTALTTTYCVDIREHPEDERLRHKVHAVITLIFVIFILLFHSINSTSVIDAVYILCSYTYGPLLGLFAFGLLTHRKAANKLIPYIAIASPLLCYCINVAVSTFTSYRFGYELLLLNGFLTFSGLWISGMYKD